MNNIDYIFLLAQILGIIGFILAVVGSNELTTKKVFKYNILCNIFYTIQYALLGGYSGAICCFIAIIRDIIFSRFKKKIPLYLLLIYIVIVILINYSFIHNVFDIIPVLNIIAFAIALWSKDILNIKIIGAFTCFLGVIYDFKEKAFTTIIKEIIDGLVGLRSIIILKKRKKMIS